MSLLLNEKQNEALRMAIFAAQNPGKVVVLSGPAGTGKCLGFDTPVMLYSGEIISVQDIKVGDKLMGPDSSPRMVLSTARGHGPLYRITPTKGDSWVCNAQHVMTLIGTNEKMGQTIDVALEDILKEKNASRNWKLWRTAVDFESIKPPHVDPYLFGLWVGDGTTGEAHISKPDDEIFEYIASVAPRYNAVAVRRGYGDKCPRIEMVSNDIRHNKLRRFFKSVTISGEKRIGREYLRGSKQTRLSVLAGIVDTDGHLSDGGIEIATKFSGLKDDILFLARSLGFAAYAKVKIATIKSISFSGSYWRVFISGDVFTIPALLARRQAQPRKQIKRVNVSGWEASPVGDGSFYGFILDGDGRFLLGDFTVTHNTTSLKQICETLPGSTILTPTGRAALRAKEVTGQEAMTIHRWMYKPVVDEKTGEISQWSRRNWDEVALPDSKLIIIDEASMVHKLIWEDIYKLAQGAGLSILLVGDNFQLPPVTKDDEEAFSVFYDTFKHDMRVNLTEVFRQALDSPIIRVATAIRETTSWKNAQEALSEFAVDSQKGIKDSARKMMELANLGQDVAMISYTNATRHDANRKVRMEWQIDPDSNPLSGEPLLVRKNSYTAGVFNGQIVDFTGFDSEYTVKGHRFGDTIINDVRSTLSFSELLGGVPPLYEITKLLGKRYISANLGYCLTCHSAQGSEWDHVIILFEKKLLAMEVEMRIRWCYTSLTRARTDVYIYNVMN